MIEINIKDNGRLAITNISNKIFFFFPFVNEKSYGSSHNLVVERIKYIIQYKQDGIAT